MSCAARSSGPIEAQREMLDRSVERVTKTGVNHGTAWGTEQKGCANSFDSKDTFMQSVDRAMIETELLPVLSDAEVDALAHSMDNTGIAILRDVIPDDMLAQARSYISRELDRHGGEYFFLEGVGWVNASPLAELGRSVAFRHILKGLWERGMQRAAPDVEPRPSLRVLAGEVGLRHAGLFHYDSYVVTALVPLVIPDGPDEPHGDLVMYPNLRRVRRSVIVNILEKAVAESAWGRAVWRMPAVQRRFAARAIPMQPGNIYFFWGMRSLHANLACLPESVRSTVLFHFGDPHAGGILKRLSAWRHHVKMKRLNRMPRSHNPL